MSKEENKDKRKIMFVTLAAVIAGVTCLNIYLSTKISKDNNQKELKMENQMLLDQNKELKKKVKDGLPSSQEQQRRDYLQVTEKFIKLAFERKKENYTERKKEATKIMNQPLLEQFYPTEEYILPETFSSQASDIKMYLQEHDNSKSEVNVLAEFTNVTKDSAKNTEDKVTNLLRVILKKSNEEWKVESVEELNMKLN